MDPTKDSTPDAIPDSPSLEASKVKEQLRKWLGETTVKSACACGVRNYLKERRLVNPRVFLLEGTTTHPPIDIIQPEYGTGVVFSQREYSARGTNGCICYDISDTDYMVAILWSIPLFAEKLGENKFNIRCIKTGECNENLYKFLNEHSRIADGEVVQEENGYRICACMGREAKSLLIVDVYQCGHIGALRPTDPIRGARLLETRLHDWISHSEVKNVCGIGINNQTSTTLLNPAFYLYSGTCTYEPAVAVDPQMSSASLFCKREFSLLGTSGCLCYDLKDSVTSSKLVVIWYIPLIETMQENRFYASVINKTNETEEDLYKRLWKETRRARDGEAMREDTSFQVFARMDATTKALLLVNIRPAKKQWSLW